MSQPTPPVPGEGEPPRREVDPSSEDDERRARAPGAVAPAGPGHDPGRATTELPGVDDGTGHTSSAADPGTAGHDPGRATTELPGVDDGTGHTADHTSSAADPGDQPAGGGGDGPGTAPRHLKGRSTRPGLLSRFEDDDGPQALKQKAILAGAIAPLVLVGVLVVAWAVDNAAHSGQVQRNVQIAGQDVGGASEDSLPPLVGNIAEEVGDRPVVVEIQEQEHQTTAGELGLSLDETAVTDAAMAIGRDEPLVQRPFAWFGSLFTKRRVSLEYTVTETQLTSTLQGLQTEAEPARAEPVEPRVELQDGEFVAVPGQPGVGLDSAQAREDLLAAVGDEHEAGETISLVTSTTEVAPAYSHEEARELAGRANELTADGLTLTADGTERELSTQQLRSLLTVDITADDRALQFDTEAADEMVSEAYSDLSSEPQNAAATLSDGEVRIRPSESGVRCCGDQAGANVWTALNQGQQELELEVEVAEPEYTTEEVESWGIIEPVGGSRGWRSGQDVPGPRPGFTTWEVGTGGRAHNIRLMADQVNGAVIPPGGSFSINDHIGPRQCPPYQKDTAILRGEYVQECGGGVSQFATTLFNAAYFAGLNIPTYKAHSEYFDRYPRGREATMGHPAPDLVVENQTEYGVLIQATHQGDSVTVTLWSTDHIQAEQTDIEERPSGDCQVVTTTRTRTLPGGSTTTDTFSATYRPGEGEFC